MYSSPHGRHSVRTHILPNVVLLIGLFLFIAPPALRAQGGDRGPTLRASYRLAKPRSAAGIVDYSRPDTVLFLCSDGGTAAVQRVIEVRRNGKLLRVSIAAGGAHSVLLPHDGDWDRNEDTAISDPAPYQAQLVLRSRDGREHRSNVISIPVRLSDSRFEHHAYRPGLRINRYALSLFHFDRADLTPMNERILSRYVYEDITNDAEVEVIGHMDTIGLPQHNMQLSERRAAAVAGAIRDHVPAGGWLVIEERGVGSGGRLYTNALPEGRFYNRTTQIIVYREQEPRVN
ncbi:MAG TPA: OmpA family protein [Candidatus Kapabacteria bacterium]|nr:OmpA family protein [Candidatus Kapabacteria bacterium]